MYVCCLMTRGYLTVKGVRKELNTRQSSIEMECCATTFFLTPMHSVIGKNV